MVSTSLTAEKRKERVEKAALARWEHKKSTRRTPL